MTKQTDRPYTAAVLAREAGISPSYVTRLCRRGDIEAVKVGRVWIIYPDEARRFLEMEHPRKGR